MLLIVLMIYFALVVFPSINKLVILHWIYKNVDKTFWYTQLIAVFDLLVSKAGKNWLDYIVFSRPHIPFGLIMDVQSINTALLIHMVKNT